MILTPIPPRSVKLPGLSLCPLFLALLAAPLHARATFQPSHEPEGVCFPVDGVAFVGSGVHRVAVGNLTPVWAGDSVFVKSGRITVVDLRSKKRLTGGAGEVLTLPAREKRTKSSWERAQELLVRRLTEPERRRGGSTRASGTGPVAALWPSGVRFGAGVRVVFQWDGVRPDPATMRIAGPSGESEVALGARAGSGSLLWPGAETAAPGTFRWKLLGADGTVLGESQFEVLSPEETARERERYLKAANVSAKLDAAMQAALLAAVDDKYLW